MSKVEGDSDSVIAIPPLLLAVVDWPLSCDTTGKQDCAMIRTRMGCMCLLKQRLLGYVIVLVAANSDQILR